MPESVRQIETEPRPHCFVCGERGRVLHEKLADFMFDAPGAWNLKECPNPNCGLAWLDPFPKKEDLPLAYERYYTHSEATGGAPTPNRNVRALLYSIYQKTVSVPGLLMGIQKEKRDLNFMFLQNEWPGRVLDVGCGDGGFLNRMKSCGWSVEGVDFDEQAIQNARAKYGISVHHGDIKAPRFPAESFNAITLNHVIEHVPIPLEVFEESRRILVPGGKLVMTTPNIRSLGHRVFKKYWRGLEPPRHLHIFSRDSLSECARRTGLEIEIAMTTAGNADIITGASYSILESPVHRTEVEPRPSLARAAKALSFQYREHFQRRHDPDCGEEVVLVCRRNRT